MVGARIVLEDEGAWIEPGLAFEAMAAAWAPGSEVFLTEGALFRVWLGGYVGRGRVLELLA